jgi:hypothetical protein
MILVTAREERQMALDRIMALRANPYDVLVSSYLDNPTHEEVVGASGTRYDVEVAAFWDKPRSPGQLRVRVAVDALPVVRKLHALTSEDFIIAPDGTFVGE